MATGIDVAAGVAGLITLADVVISRTYKTIKACKNAGKDSQRLLREVQALLGILSGLHNLAGEVSKASIESHIPGEEILGCQRLLIKIREKLTGADPDEPGLSTARKWTRILKWPISSQETDEILKDVDRFKSTFDLSVSIDTLQTVFAASVEQTSIARGVEDVRKAMQNITRIQVTEEKQRVLEFFHTFEAEISHGANTQLRQSGTGLWLTKGADFQGWLRKRNSKLWMYGIPGAGKTVLAAAAIEEVIHHAGPEYAVAYYYCDYKVAENQRLERIYSCLAGQLARQNENCFTELEREYRSEPGQMARRAALAADKMSDILFRLIANFDSVAIIVDGVDECEDAGGVAMALANLASQCPEVHLLIASRDEQIIRKHLAEFQSLSIAAQTEDLELYVAAEIQERTRKGTLKIKNVALKDDIIEALVKGAQGMFRWVACQMDHLCGLPTDGARRRALKELPPDLHGTYDRILYNVNQKGEDVCNVVERVMKWLYNDIYNLNNKQICEAVTLHPGILSYDADDLLEIDVILDCCGSLVRSSTDGQGLELAHFTVKEYLRSKRLKKSQDLARYYCNKEIVGEYKAMTTLTSICLNNFDENTFETLEHYDNLIAQSPFYLHAARRWPEYMFRYMRRSKGKTRQPVVEFVERFFKVHFQQLNAWKRVYIFGEWEWYMEQADMNYPQKGASRDQKWSQAKILAADARPQHLAAMLCNSEVSRALLLNGNDLNERCALGTPLHCVLFGRAVILFAMGGELPTQKYFNAHTTATMLDLIRLGADPTAPIYWKGICHRSAEGFCTLFCIGCRERDLLTVESLLECDAQMDRHSILAQLDRSTLVGMGDDFLDLVKGQNVSEDDGEIFTELCATLAREKLQIEAARKTEDPSMIQPPMNNIDIESSLRWACETDAPELLVFLVDTCHFDLHKGVDHLKRPLLHVAAHHDSLRVARYLLQLGVDANKVDASGCTPLHAAFLGDGSMALVRLLLEYGAKVDTLSSEGNTSLQVGAIARRGTDLCVTTLSLLLKGANLDHRNKRGHSIFHIIAIEARTLWLIALRDCLGIEQLRKALRLPDEEGMLPIHLAALYCSTDLLKMILEMDPYPAPRESDGRNVLHFAAQGIRMGTSAVAMLLERGFDVAAKAHDGSTPVHDCVTSLKAFHYLASEQQPRIIAENFQRAIQMLHTHGCEIAEPRQYLETPLHYLCKVIGNDGFCPNDSPCEMCREIATCINVLVEYMQDEKVEDGSGNTAISILLATAYRCERSKPIEYNHAAIGSLIHLLDGCVSVDPKYLRLGKKSALGVAAFVRNEALLLRLLELDANVDSDDEFEIGCFTPVQILCLRGIDSRRVVDSVLARTAEIHKRDKHDRGLLHMAVFRPHRSEHHTVIINALLDAGISVDSLGGFPQTTPLMLALEIKATDRASTLLARGANPSIRDSSGWAPFTLACHYGLINIAQSLLDAGATWDFVYSNETNEVFGLLYRGNHFYMGPLALAVVGGHTEMVQRILEWQLDGCERLENPKGPSPLWWASYFGNQQIAEMLLQSGAKPDTVDPVVGVSCLQIAAANGHVSVMKILLDAGCDANARDSMQRTASTHATVFKRQTAINLLSGHLASLSESSVVSRGPGVDLERSHEMRFSYWNFSPNHLIHLIQTGDIEAVRRVQADGIDMSQPFKCGCTPLILAIMSNQLDICDFLLNENMSTNSTRACESHGSERYNCYELAVSKSDRMHLLTKLLETSHWIALREQDRVRQFADMLCIASVVGNVPAVQELIRRNVNPNWISCARFPQDDLGKARWLPVDGDLLPDDEWVVADGHAAPLHAAILANQLDVAQILLAEGADVNLASRAEDLGTALHLAARIGEHKGLNLLLEQGANPHAVDRRGWTPAHYAACYGHGSLLGTLAKHGADLSQRDTYSASVLITSISNDNLAIGADLVSQGHALCESPETDSDILRVLRADCSPASRTFVLNVACHLEAGNYLERAGLPTRWMLRILKKLSPVSLLRNVCFKRGSNASFQDLSGIHQAAAEGSTETIQLLVDAGAMINLQSGNLGSPLMYASANGRVDIVKLLVRHGALISYRKHSTVFSAVKAARHFPEVIRWLIQERFMDQRKLTNETNDTSPRGLLPCHGVSRQTSFAPATSMREVPWDTSEFIAAEDVDDFVRRKLDEMRLGTFLCRQDGHVELITRGGARQ